MPPSPFQALAYANRLANARLNKACLALRPEEFEAPRTGFFPTLKATFNHILIVDWFYVDALEGGNLGSSAWADEQPFADAKTLRGQQASVDDRLIIFCEAMVDPFAEVKMHRAAGVVIDTVQNVLLHLFLHQTHHRGQIHAMLSGTSVAPPQLDEFIMHADATARSKDMREIGWTEEFLYR